MTEVNLVRPPKKGDQTRCTTTLSIVFLIFHSFIHPSFHPPIYLFRFVLLHQPFPPFLVHDSQLRGILSSKYLKHSKLLHRDVSFSFFLQFMLKIHAISCHSFVLISFLLFASIFFVVVVVDVVSFSNNGLK